MPRFFIDTPIHLSQLGDVIDLPATIYHHWGKVLRAKVGDKAVLFDGQGGEYDVTLIDINKKHAQVRLDNHSPINRAPPCEITLGLVVSRGERMDYAIQKATELGVARIQLLSSERCQVHLKYDRDVKKIQHWQGVAIAACEQCGLNLVPQIIAPLELKQWVSLCADELKLVLTLGDGSPAFDALPKRIALLVGAEGGLSDDEIAFACTHGFVPWCLGERVLRTETAPVVALTALYVIGKVL